MADWTSIPDATFDPDRPVLGSTHLAIVKNFEALAEGATGAPLIERAAIDDAIINRVKLDTGTSSVSGSLAALNSIGVTMNPYSFFPRVTGSAEVAMTGATGGTTADEARFRLLNTSSDNANSYSVAWRFINA